MKRRFWLIEMPKMQKKRIKKVKQEDDENYLKTCLGTGLARIECNSCDRVLQQKK